MLTVWQDGEIVVYRIPHDMGLSPKDAVNHWLNANDCYSIYDFTREEVGPGYVELEWIDSIGKNDAEYLMKARIDYDQPQTFQ